VSKVEGETPDPEEQNLPDEEAATIDEIVDETAAPAVEEAGEAPEAASLVEETDAQQEDDGRQQGEAEADKEETEGKKKRKKGKKEKKKKKEKDETEKGKGAFWSSLRQTSPFMVMLGLSLLVILISILLLYLYLGRYDFDIWAEKAKTGL